jgi:adenylate cyclase
MKKFLKIVFLSVFVVLFSYLIIFHSPLTETIYIFDAKIYDIAVKTTRTENSHRKIENIVIVDIDPYSVSSNQLGKFRTWPFDFHAKVIENISRDNPKAIAFDIIFIPEKDKKKNQILSNAFAKSGKVIGSIAFTRSNPENFLEPDPAPPSNYNIEKDTYIFENKNTLSYDIIDAPFVKLFNSTMANGSVVIDPDPDGVTRRLNPTVAYQKYQYPLLGVQLFTKVNDIQSIQLDRENQIYKFVNSKNETIREVPTDRTDKIQISYFGGYDKFRVIPYYSILKNENFDNIPQGYFKDKYVLIGTTVPGLYDLRATPVSKIYPGVGIHANALNMLLTEKYTKRLSKFDLTLVIFFVVLFTGLIVRYTKIYVALPLLIFLYFIQFIFSVQIYGEYFFWVQTIPVVFSSILSVILIYAYQYWTEEKNKQQIRSAFSQFVTKAVVDELLADPSKLKLGGERKECTVFFSDVAGFTTISEKLEPEQLVHLLNIYLTDMTNEIFKNKGMIDKYIGDAIMAVFGAPISIPNHAYLACKAAIDQQRKITELQKYLEEQKLPNLIARMGINTGDMIVGNMGSDDYFNYTVMGDSVNLAARLEPANKVYDTLIMMGETTYNQVKDNVYSRQLDLTVVKGKTEPVKVYELVGLKEYKISDLEKEILDIYSRGYELYLQKDFLNALQEFKRAERLKPNDGPSKVYIERCHYYLENKPEDDWTGVFVMKTK